MSWFAKEIIDEEWGNYFELTRMGYGALIAVMVVILLAACFISGQKGKQKEEKGLRQGAKERKGSGEADGTNGERKFSTRQLVFSSMAMALAMVTSMMKIIDMPMGGSVTLFSMFFICLIGYWYGLKSGLMTAVAYGFLQLIVDPYIISIPQMLTDYIFAFGALGLSGIFSKAKHGLIKGYIVGVLGRYFFTFLSGMIFFGSYAAGYHMTAFLYSLEYNGAYIGLEALLTLLLVSLPPVNKGLAKIKAMALGE